MKIVITGDVSTWNLKSFSVRKINQKVLKELKSSDLVIYNLEGLIKIEDTSIRLRSSAITNKIYTTLLELTGKQQPVVFSDLSVVDLLTQNRCIVTLANNHVKDLGPKGLINTVEILKSNHILYVGAGNNLKTANQPLVYSNLCVINVNYVGSQKFFIPFRIYNATKKDFGAAFMTLTEIKTQISRCKKLGKKIILIIHAGKELAKTSKELNFNMDNIKKLQADVTVVHHPHLYIKTDLEKNNIFILGDFIFHRPDKLMKNRPSAYLKVEINKKINCKIIPFNMEDIYNYEN